MTAPEESDIDPRRTAESASGAPEDAYETDGDRDLAELFGPLLDEDVAPPVDRGNRSDLAALFARPDDVEPATEHEPDFAADIERVFAPEKSTPDEEYDVDAAAPSTPATPARTVADAFTPERTAGESLPVAASQPPAASAADDVADGFTPVRARGESIPAAPLQPPVATTADDAAVTTAFDTGATAADETAGTTADAAAETTAFGPRRGTAGDAVATTAIGAASIAASTAAASDRESEAPSSPDDPSLAPEPTKTDPLAWLDLVDNKAADTPEKAALGSWLGVSEDSSATRVMPASATDAGKRTQVLASAAPTDAAAGSFSPAPRRGIRGWSSRARWSVAVSIVLLVALVAGSIWVARAIADNNLAAQELAAAVAELEAAEAAATEPQSVLDTAIADYDATVEVARATAEAAAPPLAAVAGMAAQPLLDASNAALAALIATLDADPPAKPPAPYERGDVDLGDIDAVRAATERAEDHAERVLTATREANAARTALQQNLDALRVAQVALGASLPETAVMIVDENEDASQELSDAVIAAAAAVGAAQNAGGSGDAELLAYAAAVTALREDQAREAQESTPVRPAPEPEPEPEPVPPPAPAPVPPPAPVPTPTPTEPPPPPADEPPTTP